MDGAIICDCNVWVSGGVVTWGPIIMHLCCSMRRFMDLPTVLPSVWCFAVMSEIMYMGSGLYSILLKCEVYVLVSWCDVCCGYNVALCRGN